MRTLRPVSSVLRRAVRLGAATAALTVHAAAAVAAPPDDRLVLEPGAAAPAGAPGRGRTVVLVSGDEEYRSEEALPQLGRILAERLGFRCTVLFAIDPETGAIDPDRRDVLPGLDALATADLMIIATRFRALPDADMAHLDAYVRSGRPIVGLRTATHAFAPAPDSAYARYAWNHRGAEWEGGFGRAILGETWIAHHGDHGTEGTRGAIDPEARAHPIARGLADGSIFGTTDVYRVRLPLPDGCTPIVRGLVVAGMTPDAAPVTDERNDPAMPIAWTREQPLDDGGVRRVFTTTMGAATDLESEGVRRMIVHGALWALGLENAIPPGGADVRLVGDYAPSPFGFGGARKGVRPRDLAP